MKAIFTLLLFLLALASSAQRITYDTTISGWNARVTYDRSKADSSEGIIYFPGAGEVGTDPSKLLIYGPHYWMQNGWDGAVQLGNGTHYPIYISLQPPSQSVLTGPNIKVRLDAILARYKIKRKAFYLTGPSAGGFASWTFVTYQPTAGDHSYGDMVTAIMCPESVKPNSQQGATPAYPQNTVQWIQRGKYALGFNQINDGGRDMQTYYSAMNAAAPGAATYYSTDFSGGTHCCFQEFWDPYITSWGTNSVGLPIGAGVPEGWNTYQWLLRKGDTSLTSPPPSLPVNQSPVSKPGSAKAITLPVSSVTLDGSASADADGTIASYAWSQVSGPSTATIAAVGGKTTLVSALAAGTYVFQLKVTDNSGASGTATVQVTVSPAANQAPSANAGANPTITLPVSSVTLDGSASADADGTIASYAWSQVSGPSTATIAAVGGKTTLVSALVQGTYVFRLTVKDNSGATATDDVNVTVNAAVNQLPAANAGANPTITLPVSSVTLDGSASSDADGTIASYAWSQVSGPSTATIAAVGGKTTLVSALVQGTYVFRLTVKDNSGATATDDVNVTVNAAVNQLPVANPGAAQAITLPVSSVTLNGSASSDPDGTIASYAWSQVSGPSTATLGTAGSVSTAAGGLVAGTYIFQLKVTDNDGASATAQVKVTVADAANQNPVANGGSNQTITLPVSSVTLSGSASSDPNGSIASYAWSQVSGPSTATLGTAGSVSTTAGGLVAGTYVFELKVTDNSGATATDDITIMVNAAVNKAPVANAGANLSIILPVSSVTLSGSASSDADGTIASYAWSQVSGPSTATLGTAGSVSTTAGGLVAGTYVFELKVTDNKGATATDDVNVTVSAAVNKAPVANAGANLSITLPVSLVTLSGSASSDPDGTIASYVWSQVSGPSTATLGTAGSVSTTAGGLVAGTYVFELKVTDNNGATATDDVNVTVNAAVVPPPAANEPPVANAGADQNIDLPVSSISLDGRSSYDPDGTIASYSWLQVSGIGGVSITNSNTATPSLYGLKVGSYVFQLTVKDNAGAEASDQVAVVVNQSVQAPSVDALKADAGTDTAISLTGNNGAMLNGTSSTDAGGTITGYEWTQVSGPAGAVIGSPTSGESAINNLVAGVYVFQLTVTNDKGNRDSATVQVRVIDNQRNTGKWSLYPNPAHDVVNLSISNVVTGKMSIVVADISGRVMLREEATKAQQDIIIPLNVSGLAKGYYFIKIMINSDNNQNGSERPKVLPLIKQ